MRFVGVLSLVVLVGCGQSEQPTCFPITDESHSYTIPAGLQMIIAVVWHSDRYILVQQAFAEAGNYAIEPKEGGAILAFTGEQCTLKKVEDLLGATYPGYNVHIISEVFSQP